MFVFRAWFYCKACHEDIKDETLIKKCKCKNYVGMLMMQTGMVKGENMNQSYVEGTKVLSNLFASLACVTFINLLAILFSFIDRPD
ncbi:Calcium-activated potassium channel subunit alpha-1 [Homalodisca vitripennis]|nr:Calcium-activated potassium channel subunit alpha-1 [Homalodisca vitripennis]